MQYSQPWARCIILPWWVCALSLCFQSVFCGLNVETLADCVAVYSQSESVWQIFWLLKRLIYYHCQLQLCFWHDFNLPAILELGASMCTFDVAKPTKRPDQYGIKQWPGIVAICCVPAFASSPIFTGIISLVVLLLPVPKTNKSAQCPKLPPLLPPMGYTKAATKSWCQPPQTPPSCLQSFASLWLSLWLLPSLSAF